MGGGVSCSEIVHLMGSCPKNFALPVILICEVDDAVEERRCAICIVFMIVVVNFVH